MKPNNLLKRERELRGWSQARVAEEIGTTAMNVGRWERGISMPYPHFRAQLCQLFGKDAAALGLLESEDEPSGGVTAAPELVPGGSLPALAVYDPAIPVSAVGNVGLVGRDALLAHLKQRLCGEAQPTIVALNGLPGAGKTALAISLAYDPEVRACFQDGILWAALGPQPDVMELLGRWGVLLGMSAATAGKLGTSEAWARALRTLLGQRRLLLIIDDAWQLEEALAFQVGGAHCAYLVTTRYPQLAAQLAASGALNVPELSEQDGVALLTRYAGKFVQSAPETTLDLVHSVGALPLALALMGKYLSVQAYSGQPRRLHTAVEYLRDARARLQLSETRALTERHPSIVSGTTFSLQSVIAVSEQPLDEYARAALRALSVFPAKPNCFSEEAALEVCQTSVETLDKLCDAGLLESNGPSSYWLHQTISDYARASLTDPAVSERLVDYYVHFAEEKRDKHELLAAEASNILAALEAAYIAHHREALVRGVCAFASFLQMRGLYSVAEKHLKRAHEAARILGDTSHIVNTLLYLGPIELAWGHVTQAESYLLDGLTLARQINNIEQLCKLLNDLAVVEQERGNFSRAEAYHSENLLLARKLGKQEEICRLLTNMGVLAGKRGGHGQARAYFREGLVLARQSGYQQRIATLVLDLGRVEYELGNYWRSEVYYQEALRQGERLGYPVHQGVSMIFLAELTMRQGHFTRCLSYLQRAMTLLQQIGNHLWIGHALLDLGMLAALEGDDQRAVAYFQECLAVVQRISDREIMGSLFEEWGKLEARRGNYQQAEDYLRDALQIERDLGINYLICSALFARGELYIQCQRLAEAEQSFIEMSKTVAPDQRELQALSLYGLARLAAARQNVAEARQQGQASLAIFSSIGHYRAAEAANWLAGEELSVL